MADTNAIIEENEQNVGEYDPNPYDNVTVEEALKQLFNRFTPRTVRQAIFTMAENNKPATLIEKSITENGEYAASADNADGYSSVTVAVSGEPHFNGVTTLIVNPGASYASRIMLCKSENGEYILSSVEPSPSIYILLDPVVKVTVPAPGTTITFTPDENFDGFYSTNGRKMSHTGDEATAGDGMTYQYVTSMGGNTMTKTSYNFMFTIE